MKRLLIVTGIIAALALTTLSANHSWGPYHWARTTNPLALKLQDNLTSTWDPYLGVASADWSASSVIDTTVVAGVSGGCTSVDGRAVVCNGNYGRNGWLGLATIWIDGDHIYRGQVKMNDFYFKKSPYNKPAWKQSVICQEVGHIFGLDHQDEDFYNANLDTCMDYTSYPTTNQHPNAHDYEQLELIYAHLDPFDSSYQGVPTENRYDEHGRPVVTVERHGNKTMVTWTLWADEG